MDTSSKSAEDELSSCLVSSGQVAASYDQESFEAEVVASAEARLAETERQREVQRNVLALRTVVKQLTQLKRNLAKCEQAMQHSLSSQAASTSRKQRMLLDEQEKMQKERDDLLKQQTEIALDLNQAGFDMASQPDLKLVFWNELEPEPPPEKKKAATKDAIAVPSLGGKKRISHHRPSEAAEAVEAGPSGETEKERRIRLGQMTAFGKELASTTEMTGSYDAYVQDMREDETSSSSQSRSQSHVPAAVEKRGRPRTTKRRKRSEEEKEEEEKAAVDSDDASDWASSDDEVLRRKERQLLSRRMDDGDRELYLLRLDRWQAGRTDKDRELDAKCESISASGGGNDEQHQLRVPSRIWNSLYNYQKVCVQWLWELHQQKVGGILGDEMGLGKTVQIIAFLASMSFSQRRGSGTKKFGPVLIVCPTTVMHQWVREFHKWWPLFRVAVLHDSGSHKGSRTGLIRSLVHSHGVLVTSYSGAVAHKDRLLEHEFDYLILDEGHKIRNPDAQVTLSVKMFPTTHRIILSGSPLQNNLKELWSLFDFIFPGKLGTLPVFLQQFSVPITEGGYANASRVQVATAYKCATILRDTINPYLLRRMKNDVKQHINLPEKNEQVLFCRLTDEQRSMYKSYLDSGEIRSIMDGRLQIFVGLTNLRKMCNHPDLFDGGPNKVIVRADGKEEEQDELLQDDASPSEPELRFGYWRRSGKMVVIESLLKLWQKQGHRVLLFTQSRRMLLILESFVRERNYPYLKLDGSTPIGSRQVLIDRFNENKDLFVFLLTTKVGGLGVNLTGASRVVIFDPDWNPSTDMQARERAWRIGQEKQVTIYRLMTAGTIEEKIYHRQIFKQFLVNRVLKDPKQRRFFKSNDLYELFTLNEGTSDRTETSAIFAGTGSDVKLKKKRKSKEEEERERDNKPAEPVPSFRPKEAKYEDVKKDVGAAIKKLYGDDGCREEEGDEKVDSVRSSASAEKSERERMMERVRRISKKLGGGANSGSGGSGSSSSTSNKERRDRDRDRGRDKRKSKKKKRARFEGQKVSHLVKTSQYVQAGSADEEDQEKEKEQCADAQDNYVLSRLFKKSGVHSAVQHDRIVEGEGDDFALVEGEAERVAKEAVDKLRQSRRECYSAEAGVPSWTGSHGVVASKKNRAGPRFGVKKRTGEDGAASDKMFSGSGQSRQMSSSDLLAKMRQRNRFQSSTTNGANDNLFRPDNSSSSRAHSRSLADSADQMELLTDIRNFVSFQSAADGRASTFELVERFKTRLPPQQSPLFKALLNEICQFHRESDGKGMWTLKTEFM